jgi:predicted RND superfamily exporter protein
MELKYQPPAIAEFAVNAIQTRPKTAIFLGLILLLILLAGAGNMSTDFSYRSNLSEDSPIIKDFDNFESRFGNDDMVVLALSSKQGIFTTEAVNKLKKMTADMWLLPDVTRVDSLANFQLVVADGDDIRSEFVFENKQVLTPSFLASRKQKVLAHKTLPSYLISKDSHTTLLFAQIRPPLDKPLDALVITTAIRALVEKHEEPNFDIYISGSPPLEAAFAEIAIEDNSLILPLVIIVCFTMLLFITRKFSLSIITLLIIVVSAVAATTSLGWLGIKLNSITASLTHIILAIAIADTVHLLATYKRVSKFTNNAIEASRYALLKNFFPTIVTTITTSAGFLSIATSKILPIAELGLSVAFGAITTWFITYLILGGVLFHLKISPKNKQIKDTNVLTEKISEVVINKPKTVVAVTGFIVVVCAVLTSQIKVESDPIKYFKPDHPLRLATEFIEKDVGASRMIEIVVEGGSNGAAKKVEFLHQVAKFEDWIEEQQGITKVLSLVDILKDTNQAFFNDDPAHHVLVNDQALIAQEILSYIISLPIGGNIESRITLNEDALHLTVLWTIGSSSKALAMIEHIETQAKHLDLEIVVTGKYQIFQRLEKLVVDSFITSVIAAFLLISVLLMIFFRSIWLGALAIIPNIVPIVVGGAVLALTGETLNVGTVLIISVALGIAVDDTVHILSEFSQLRRSGVSKEASIREVITNTSPTLLVTTMVLVVCFSMFGLASFTPMQMFGVTTAVCLGSAYLFDITLLPALLMLNLARDKKVVNEESVVELVS